MRGKALWEGKHCGRESGAGEEAVTEGKRFGRGSSAGEETIREENLCARGTCEEEGCARGKGVRRGRVCEGERCARGVGVRVSHRGRWRRGPLAAMAVPIYTGGTVRTTIPMMWRCVMRIRGGVL